MICHQTTSKSEVNWFVLIFNAIVSTDQSRFVAWREVNLNKTMGGQNSDVNQFVVVFNAIIGDFGQDAGVANY